MKSYPIVKHLPTFMSYRSKTGDGLRLSDVWTDLIDQHGPIVLTGSTKTAANEFLVSSADYLKVLEAQSSDDISGVFELIWSIRHFYERKFPDEPLNPFLSRGEAWRKGRLAVNPHMFNAKAAKSYLPQINKASRAAVQHIGEYEEDVDGFCKYASMDMFNAMALGLEMNATAGDVEDRKSTDVMAEALKSMVEVLIKAPWSEYDMLKFGAWKKFEEKFIAGCDEVEMLLERSMADPNNTGFMRAFLESEKEISRFQAVSMVTVLMFAAADTTAATLANVLLNLSRNSEVQAKLREELRAELNGADWADDSRCDYLNWILYENQRLTPTLSVSHSRSAIEQDVEIEGFLVEKGSTVSLVHRRFAMGVDDPKSFKPERWSDEEKAKRKGTPLEFLDHPIIREPFGFGPRKCVGSRVALLELKAILARIVQDYEFHMDEETSAPFEIVSTVTNTPSPFPHIRFKRLDA